MSHTLAFKYSAITHECEIVHGVLRAINFERAKHHLLKQFAHLLVLKESQPLSLTTLFQPRPRVADLALYTRQLATMIHAGVPFIKAFHFVAEGEHEAMNVVFRDVANQVGNGKPVSRALTAHPEVFDELFLSLVANAEQTGGLHAAFVHLADLLEKRVNLRSRILSSLAYPFVVGMVSLAVFSMFLFFVVPQMVPMFQSIGQELPALTLAMLSLAQVVQNPLTWVVAFLTFGVAGPVAYRYAYAQKQVPQFRYLVDEWALKLKLVELGVLNRVLDTLSTMLETGMSPRDAIRGAARASGNEVFKSRLLNSLRFLENGHSLTSAFRTWNVFPPMVLSMVELGEHTGTLPYLLKKTANLMAEDLEHEVSRLTTLVEPVLMMVTGLGVGLIVLASFLPIISLVSQL